MPCLSFVKIRSGTRVYSQNSAVFILECPLFLQIRTVVASLSYPEELMNHADDFVDLSLRGKTMVFTIGKQSINTRP